jgi:hypothetical protein
LRGRTWWERGGYDGEDAKEDAWRRVDGVWDGMKILCVGFLSVTIFFWWLIVRVDDVSGISTIQEDLKNIEPARKPAF